MLGRIGIRLEPLVHTEEKTRFPQRISNDKGSAIMRISILHTCLSPADFSCTKRSEFLVHSRKDEEPTR